MADIEVKLKDNTKEIQNALEEQIESALTAIGMMAETHAKEEINEAGAIDTGRLINSVTFALAGQSANIESYKANFTRYKTKSGKTAIRRKNLKKYQYKGKAPKDKKGEHSVYIGTNVEYAKGIETGSHRKAGAVHFLKKAATEHSDEYKQLTKEALGK